MKKTKHGFELLESREITEIRTIAHRYLHKKSGTELLYLECDDTNKVFNIGFKTIPEDDTGCPHILEHSVLNGSEAYPAKGTFMELIKGSLNTFINAMTAPDWTTYPVASTNDKDFMNLMKVYLDAVLKPLIHQEDRIMDQEGWHYELHDPDGEIEYRGVVYNEMKGAFSSVDSIVSRYCTKAQFPDTPYGFESGGDPEAIPELTHEKFKAFHKKYYHPSNSKIALYGNLDIDAALQMIDTDYLSHYKAPGEQIEFPLQKPFAKVKKMELEYPLADGQQPEGQYYLALNYTYGKITDPHLSGALSLLNDILMRSPASPLKKAIRDSGLCKDSSTTLSADILQPTISIVCKQVKQEDLEPLAKIIHDELKRIVKQGLDKHLIEAMINSREFFLREAQIQRFPKGLYYILGSLGEWLHGGDPLEVISFEDFLKEVKRGLTEPYFENLIEAVFLKNKHASQVTFVPVPGLIARQDAELKERLAAYKKSLNKKQIEQLIKQTQELTEWQETPDTHEDIQKIPLLSLDDVDPKAAEFPTDKEVWREFTLLKHPLNTNGIVYFRAYFDMAHAAEADLPWLMLYTQLLGQINSQNYSYADLSNEIQTHTGGISVAMDIYNSYQTPDDIIPKLIISGKAVKDKVPRLMELAAEFAMHPSFDDPDRIKSLIRELKARMEMNVIQGGVSIAIKRMFAPFSQLHDWQDKTSGLAYYHFLVELESRLDEDINEIMGELIWVQKNFFGSQNLLISLTANEEILPNAFDELGAFISHVAQDHYAPVPHQFITRNVNEGIPAPVKIQYVVKGGNFFRKGYSYTGKLRVLSNILSNEYLYKELRVKGGAYGGGAGFTLDGYQYFYSYRDPNLRETLDVYDSVPEYLRNFDCEPREMVKYILGEISSLDYPRTPEATGVQADLDYITGFTYADRQQIRDEVLATKAEDIRSYADMIEAIMTKNHYAVFGNEDKIKQAAEFFDVITPVYKQE